MDTQVCVSAFQLAVEHDRDELADRLEVRKTLTYPNELRKQTNKLIAALI